MAIGKILKYGIKAVKAARKAKKPKSSFKSMNPIEKAFTAAKISGRTMKSFGNIKHSEMHRPTAKFINRSMAGAGTYLAGRQLVNRNKKKKK